MIGQFFDTMIVASIKSGYNDTSKSKCLNVLETVLSHLKHGAILYNEAEVFSLSITNPSGQPMLSFDWLIHSSLSLASCHRILFLCRFSAVEK